MATDLQQRPDEDTRPDDSTEQPDQQPATEEPQESTPATQSKSSLAQKLMKRKGLLAFGAMGSIFVFGFLALFLFLAGFKLNHIRNLLIDYRFAQFHLQVAKRASHLLTQEAVLSADSTGRLPDIRKGGVLEKLRGYDPQKALTNLGNDARVNLVFDKTPAGGVRGWLNRTDNTFTGVDINGERLELKRSGSGGSPTKADMVDFASRLEANIDTAFPLKNSFFRSSLAADIRKLAGVKLSRWQKNGDDYKNKSAAEAEKLARQERARATQGDAITTNIPGANDEAEKIRNQATDGTLTDIDDAAKTAAERTPLNTPAVKAIRAGSLTVAVGTIVCLIHETIIKNIDKVLVQRDTSYKKTAFEVFKAADQQNTGAVTAEAVGAENAIYDGFDNSAAYRRMNGEPVTEAVPDIPAELYPQMPLGTAVSVMKDGFAALDTIIKGATFQNRILNLPFEIFGKKPLPENLNDVCNIMLNPAVQGAAFVIEIAAAVFSGGTTSAGGFALSQGVRTLIAKGGMFSVGSVAKLGGQVAAIYLTTDYLIPKAIQSSSGVDIGTAKNEQAFNQADVGADLLANEFSRGSGGSPLTAAEVAELNGLVTQSKVAKADKEGVGYKLFSLNNPTSVAAKVLGGIPTTPQVAMARIGTSFASILSPLKLASGKVATGILNPAHAQAADATGEDPYGIQQFGWTKAELDRMGDDNSWTPRENAKIVEPQYDQLDGKYGECFKGRSTDLIQKDGLMSVCQEAKTNEMAQRFRLYLFDNAILENLVGMQAAQ